MKKWIAVAVVLAISASIMPPVQTVAAEPVATAISEVETQDFIYEQGDDGDIIITGYTGDFASIVIPDTIDDIAVTAIRQEAFRGNSTITQIIVGENVTQIGTYAFRDCTSLSRVVITGNVTELGEGCFQGCTLLSDVQLAEGVEIIGMSAFENCISLEEITLPESLLEIRNWAFEYCTSLREIVIPANVTSIGGWAFNGCTALESITIESRDCSIYDNGGTLCPEIRSGERYFSGVIYGYQSSTAASYASKYGCTFVPLDPSVEEDESENTSENTEVEEDTDDILLGDLDGDGVITPVDARIVLVGYATANAGIDGLTGLTPEQELTGDVDGDGSLSAIDAHYILVYYASEQVWGEISWASVIEN